MTTLPLQLVQRLFLVVRLEHRLVADTLEQPWNEQLRRLADAEEEYRRATEAQGRALSAADRRASAPWAR